MPEVPQEMASAIAGWFRALADETRIRILMHLKEEGEVSAGALAEAVGLSQTAASKQFAVLRAARIVRTRREGTTIHYSLRDESITRICSIVCGTLAEDHARIREGMELAGLHPAPRKGRK